MSDDAGSLDHVAAGWGWVGDCSGALLGIDLTSSVDRFDQQASFGSTAEDDPSLPFASGSYVSRPEIVVTEKWSRQVHELAKTGIDAGCSNT